MLSRSALILIMPFALSGTILCWAGGEIPAWYELAREIVETGAQLSAPNANALELLKAQETNIEKLKGLPSPSVKELNQLIQSPRMEEREAALATAMFLNRTDSSLIRTIMLNYEQERGFLAKIYSQLVLVNIPPSQSKAMEKQLFNILQNESEESIVITGMQNVVRLDRGKRTALFVQYMKNGSDGMLRACTVALAKLGRPDLEAVKNRLNKQGAKKAADFLDRFGEDTLREVASQGNK